MGKNKILLISDFSYPDYSGATARHTYEIYKYMLDKGVPVKLISREKNINNSYNINEELTNTSKNILKNWHKISINNINIIYGIFKILYEIKKADKIIVHFPVLGLIGSLTAKILRKRLIYFFHGPYDLEFKEKNSNKISSVQRLENKRLHCKNRSKIWSRFSCLRQRLKAWKKTPKMDCLCRPRIKKTNMARILCKKQSSTLNKKEPTSCNCRRRSKHNLLRS